MCAIPLILCVFLSAQCGAFAQQPLLSSLAQKPSGASAIKAAIATAPEAESLKSPSAAAAVPTGSVGEEALHFGNGYDNGYDQHDNGYRHNTYRRCPCGVSGEQTALREALEQWVYGHESFDDYPDSNSNGGGGQYGRVCTGRTCYRADFVDVQDGRGSEYRYAHYTVRGCMDPDHERRRQVIEFRMYQNVSVAQFLQGYNGGYGQHGRGHGDGQYGLYQYRAGHIMEMLCDHHMCEDHGYQQSSAVSKAGWRLPEYYQFFHHVWAQNGGASSKSVTSVSMGLAMALGSAIWLRELQFTPEKPIDMPQIRRSRSLAVLPSYAPETYRTLQAEKHLSTHTGLLFPELSVTCKYYAENSTSKYLPHYRPEYRYQVDPDWGRNGHLWWNRRWYNRYGFWPTYGSYPRYLSEKMNNYYPYSSYHYYRPSAYPYLKFDTNKYRGLSEFNYDYCIRG